MTETPHARSRRASLFGLVLQVLAVIVTLVLARMVNSAGLNELAFFLVGGVPIWFIALLVFRQHELAALEAMDLELLRREKSTTGGGDAMFAGEGGGGLGFLVAQQRLEWMQRWLVPFFGLVIAAYLASAGVWLFVIFKRVLKDQHWTLPPPEHQELGLVALVILTLLLFLYSRYASGMGRQTQWQLLRACGSFMLANTLAAAALAVCFGASLYSNGQFAYWEIGVAWAIPVLMVLLGVETLLNFVLDIYRPRAPGTEPRSSFDSRLLGLISEPGGIAHSLAEAINYQFGFQVSQTWFYQLLVRVAFPLVWIAAVAVWLLTSVFIVQPYELAIVERFGRQIDPENPLEPGIYVKWPWPIEQAQKYNVGQLHEFAVGYKSGDMPVVNEVELEMLARQGKVPIEQWTDAKHPGRSGDHFNFIVASPATSNIAASQPGEKGVARVPINLARMEVFVQYRVRREQLTDYVRRTQKPDDILRDIAWGETVQLVAAATIDDLLDPSKRKVGEVLRQRIGRRADEMKLGLEVVYCGLTNVHPEKVVADAFRKVVTSRQEKIAEIRRARVDEGKTLAEVAGDKSRALRLARAIDGLQTSETAISVTEKALREAVRKLPAGIEERFKPLADKFKARFDAELTAAQVAVDSDRVKDEFDLGMGRSVREVEQADAARKEARAAAAKAADELNAAFEPIRTALASALDKRLVETFLENAIAKAALDFWSANLNHNLNGLEGAAAVTLELAKASRWEHEMRAAGELVSVVNEREAYAASPAVYKARRYLDVVTRGTKDARKYFLAFLPKGRQIHVRLQTEELARPELGNVQGGEK